MRRHVPLNAIRAFEAVVRNGSVVRAASELCVTPTAVGHQIRLLEDFLQVDLFSRRNSRIFPTPGALANVARVTQALDLIDEAVHDMGEAPEQDHRSLSISVSASFASLWLVPRIGEFTGREPDTDIHVRTFLTRKDAETQDSELKICPWRGQPGFHAEPLVEEIAIPVCAPSLVDRYNGNMADILAHAPLIHMDRAHLGIEDDFPDWARYMNEYGLRRPNFNHGLRFSQSGHAIEAAVTGAGVLLGRSLLIARAVEAGKLVPVAEAYPQRTPTYLLSPLKPRDCPALDTFRTWLIETARPDAVLLAA